MAFFVLEKDLTSASLKLPIDGAYDTREDALGALSAAVTAGRATVSGQVYVVDLDTALPVLVMPAPAAAAVAPVDAPAEDVVAPEAAEPDVAPTPTTIVAGGLAEGSLADALKRAANSLEDEGIIAPDSIDAEDFSFEDDLGEDTAAEEVSGAPVPDAADDVATSIDIAEPMSAVRDEPVEILEAPADWPWANVEAFSEAPETDTVVIESPVETAEDVPAPVKVDEPDTLITSAPPLGEEAYVPRPVILGDYADLKSESASDTVAIAEPAASEDDEAAAGSTIGEESPLDIPVEAVAPESGSPAEMAYEPTGELDLSTYSCNDCVYSNTCPKVGEVTPAECGTFQWRSS